MFFKQGGVDINIDTRCPCCCMHPPYPAEGAATLPPGRRLTPENLRTHQEDKSTAPPPQSSQPPLTRRAQVRTLVNHQHLPPPNTVDTPTGRRPTRPHPHSNGPHRTPIRGSQAPPYTKCPPKPNCPNNDILSGAPSYRRGAK